MSDKEPSVDASDPSQPEDAALIAKARRQAAALDDSDLTLDAPPGDNGFIGPPPDSFTGYRIIKEVHRGGQGVVYQAVQESTSRKVAIKVMRQGPFADSSDRARFDREVQILGQLNHANIVSIHDRGTAAGCDYFVMDYVSGQPLDVYMASGERTIDESLRLFQNICDAINAAHLRGVIHRDIKPSNIRIDAEGRPHILDFGLAKMESAGVPPASGSVGAGAPSLPGVGDGTPGSVGVQTAFPKIMTITGQFIGSLPWASPEQAEAIPGKIDIRTDVYSLGVVLYQMLTGKFPYEVVGNMRDVLDRIMTVEPARPRTACKEINDEVETIVLKCLAKDRERRYQTAGELARDIQRYLTGEPIEAKRASIGYVLRKRLRRHKLPVAFAAALLLLLASSAVVSTTLWLQADEDRRLAEAAQTKADNRAEEIEQVAEFQSEQLGGVDAIAMGLSIRAGLRENLRDLAKRRGLDEKGAEQLVAEYDALVAGADFTGLALKTVDEHFFEPALRAIEEQFAEQPRVKASLLQTLAITLHAAGLLNRATAPQSQALQIRRRELGDEDPDTLFSINYMGLLLQAQGKLTEAEPYYREALQRRRSVLGEEHPDTLMSINNMGAVLRARGRFDEAEPYYREALEKGRRVLGEDPNIITKISNLGDLLRMQGKFDDAEPYHKEALEKSRRLLGEEHPLTLNAINHMGGLLQAQGKYEEAERYWREGLEKRRRVLGDEHPRTLASINNMGATLQAQGKLDQAEPYFREALEKRRRILGDEHPNTINSILNMGLLFHRQGKLDEAEPYYREALQKNRSVRGDEHPSTLLSINNLGALLRMQGEFADAEALLVPAAAVADRALPPRHPVSGYLTKAIIELYDDWHAAQPGRGYDAKAAEWRIRLEASKRPESGPDDDG